MELLLEHPDAAAVACSLERRGGDSGPMRALWQLAAEHAAGCATVAEMLRTGLDIAGSAATIDEGLARTRRLFDDSVTRNEAASVALYSLGSAALLEVATTEIISVLDAWGVLGADRDALEIGCGIGRFLVPLAPRLRSVVGIDLSPKMLDAARRRVGGLANVRVEQTTGRNLATLDAHAFDFVYSIDVFPYLVLAGRELVETHLREIVRVLRPGGDLVIFNYAYNRGREEDAAELRELAHAVGLAMVRTDQSPCQMWNGIGYHLRAGV